MKVQFEKETQNISRGQWGNVKRKFSSVSQGVNIAKKLFLCIKLIFRVNTF